MFVEVLTLVGVTFSLGVLFVHGIWGRKKAEEEKLFKALKEGKKSTKTSVTKDLEGDDKRETDKTLPHDKFLVGVQEKSV